MEVRVKPFIDLYFVNIELPIWTAYLDGKLSREKALDQIVEAFVKAQRREAAGKSQPTGSRN